MLSELYRGSQPFPIGIGSAAISDAKDMKTKRIAKSAPVISFIKPP
jgi:hypothetical protein